MATDSAEEHSFASPTFRWEMRKIRSGAAGTRQRGRSPHRWFGCYPWPRSKKLTVTLTYRGGAEGWVLVEARGRHGVFPGHADLLGVVSEVMQLQ